MKKRIHKQITTIQLPGLTTHEKVAAGPMNIKTMLESISTIDLVRELINREGVACHGVSNRPIATITILGHEDIADLCSKRFIELSREVACDE